MQDVDQHRIVGELRQRFTILALGLPNTWECRLASLAVSCMRTGIVRRFAACFTDYRKADQIEHPLRLQ